MCKDVFAALKKEPAQRHARWGKIRRHGAGDPNYSDGVNMNLVRDQILFAKVKLRKLLKGAKRPEILKKATPPKVSMKWNAKKR